MRRRIPIVAVLAILLALPCSAVGASAAVNRGSEREAARFTRAEKSFSALRASASKQRQRQNYIRVLDAYRRVFEKYPATRQGDQSLMRAGELFTLLFRWTGQEADLNQARHYYQRLVETSPKSDLVDDALLAIAYISLNQSKDPAQAWLRFREVTVRAPRGNKTGEARRQLKRLARYAAPEKPAPAAASAELSCPTPQPSVAAGGAGDTASPPRSTEVSMPPRAAIAMPPPTVIPAADPAAAPSVTPGQPVVLNRVQSIRHWSNPEYSRVVIDLDQKTNFYSNLLQDNSGSGKPPRLYIDLFTAIVEPQLCKPISIDDGILHGIRAGQFTPDSARVVLEIDGLRTYRIFPMENPFRIVIDVTGGTPGAAPVAPVAHKEPVSGVPATTPAASVNALPTTLSSPETYVPETPPRLLPLPPLTTPGATPAPAVASSSKSRQAASNKAASASRPAAAPAVPTPSRSARTTMPSAGKPSLARQLGLGVRSVVIDAGHGAHDPGAIGVGGLKEKDVTLDLALRLRTILEAAGYRVVLTRDRDVYLPLEERTAIANTARGDLFISLHCNASDDGKLSGVETYYLNLASNLRSMRTAARENSMAVANMSDLQQIVREIQNSKMDESSQFAARVQRSLHDTLHRKHSDVKNLGVKQAPFYVLIGAQMPSILAEVSFINHLKEGRRLAQDGYRNLLAQAIADGVKRYVKTVKSASSAPGRPTP